MQGTPDPVPDQAPETTEHRLQTELDTTRALLDATRASLRLQGMRAAGLQSGLDGAYHRMDQLFRSVSWRLTSPLRTTRALAAGRLPNGYGFRHAAVHVAEIARDDGLPGLGRLLRRHLPLPTLRRGPRPAVRSDEAEGSAPHPYAAPIPPDAPQVLTPLVLIVAELSIPQCAKYRVWQKQELFESLGWRCRVLNWRELGEVTTALQLCTEVIFYRVPGEPPVLALLREARRLGLDPWWEVDDLIFDEPLYRQNSNLATLDRGLRRQVLAGIRLYRAAMLDCRRAIASTGRLAAAMRDAGVAETLVIENALDSQTLHAAAVLRARRDARPDEPDRPVTIVYGSGTKTHDADFAVAGPAILALLRRHPRLRLRIVGDLVLPDGFDALGAQVEELPGTDYRAYLGLLAEADIAIAPLEDTVFNDAKSNIKFQEAAILALPSVCSPRQAFREVIADGEDGFLAADDPAWEATLERLVLDPSLRRRMGARALACVLERYAPERIARLQVAAVAGLPPQRARDRLRVLSANIFFSPQSFGGATIVAQEMAARLAAEDDVELCVFTSRPALPDRPGSLLRYDWRGVPVFAGSLSPPSDQVVQLDNPAMVETFGLLLDALLPDVVHAHSIQGFGAPILRLCQERGIPYVVTLHDAWWLCDRQFMVRADNRYCHQTRIDLRVCQDCVPHARHLDLRMRIMMGALHGASLLLSPSGSHRQLYLANGIGPGRIRVNRNGIRPPLRPHRPRVPGAPIRFGFVAGAEAIKGYHLIREAFEGLASADWELVLVDSTLNLGFRSIDVSRWKARGTITVVPAYTQDGLDAFFDRLDVLLFPSQWKESFGLAVREALARDVWVIATGEGGQADEIEDGVNGRLIPMDGKADGLAGAVAELLRAPRRLDGYRNPHAGRIASHDVQAAELSALLRSVARPRPSPHPVTADTSGSAPPASPG